MSLLAVSIAMTLLALSIFAWGRLCLAASAQPLRKAGRQMLVEPAPHTLNVRIVLVALFAVTVWVLFPAFLSGYSNQLAVRFGLRDRVVWPVVMNCISNALVLLIVGPVTWNALRDKPHPEVVPTTASAIRRIGRIQKNARAGVVGFVFAVLPVALVLLATHAIRTQEGQHSMLKLVATDSGNATTAWIVLSAVVLAPLVEELIFRVLLQGWLQTFLRPTVAIGIVALAFSAVHGWQDMLPLIPLATVLGILFYVTRSYIAVVVTHGLFNGTNLVLAILSAAESADAA